MKTLLKIVTTLFLFMNLSFANLDIVHSMSDSKFNLEFKVVREVETFNYTIFMFLESPFNLKFRYNSSSVGNNIGFSKYYINQGYYYSPTNKSFYYVSNTPVPYEYYNSKLGKMEYFTGYSVDEYRDVKNYPCLIDENYNPETDECEPIECPANTDLNPITGECQIPCVEGQVLDPTTGQCVGQCPPSRKYNPETGDCDPIQCYEYEDYEARMQCYCDANNAGQFEKSSRVCLPGNNPFDKVNSFSGVAINPFTTPNANCYCKIECSNKNLNVFDALDRSPGYCKNYASSSAPSDNNETSSDSSDSEGGSAGDNPDMNSGDWYEVDLTEMNFEDVPTFDLNQELNNVKNEISNQQEEIIIQELTEDTTVIKTKNEVNPNDYINKDENGETSDIVSNPKPGVTIIEHSNGKTSVIFEGSKMETYNQGDTNINSKDYTGQLKSILQVLKGIESNTEALKGLGDGTGSGEGDGLGDGNSTGEGDGLGEFGFSDSLEGYDFLGEIEKSLGYFDEIEKTAKDFLSFVNGKGVPSIKKTNSPVSCPITRDYISPKINESITWDICKVLHPHKDAFYIMFYLSFMVSFMIVSFRLLIILFLGLK